MPAAAFCFCRSASFGPLLVDVADFLMPADALVEDHRLANASPPVDDDAGLAAGFEKLLLDGAMPGLDPGAEAGCEGAVVGTWTDVK